jgi:hypothetical protein
LIDELPRASKLAVPGTQPPYYVALRVADSQVFQVEASFGALVSSYDYLDRRLFADVRVGSYEHDNGNFAADRSWSDYEDRSRRWLPFENDYDAIRRDAWLATDAGYKGALRAFGQKSATQTREQLSPERIADFSHEPVIESIDSRAMPPLDRSHFENLTKALSNVGKSTPSITDAEARIEGAIGRHLLVSTEGSRVIELRTRLELSVVLRARASDGMQLVHFLHLGACTPQGLPTDAALLTEVQHVAQQLEQTRLASPAEDYTGPVLFEGIAAPQILSQVLEPELSGTPPEQSVDSGSAGGADSQLTALLDQRILPPGFSLIDDPTIDHLNQRPLAGCYRVDDEGVAAQRVNLVEDGLFKAFVMSRTPRKEFAHSNGHGRESFDGIRARTANLILSSKQGLGKAQLRQRLIKAAKAAGKPHALIIQVLDYPAHTQQRGNNWFGAGGDSGQRVLVLTKLTLDGKEQPLRGASLQTIELGSLKRILAAGNTPSVFSRYSNSVVSPALLFDDVTIKKASAAAHRPPLTSRPNLDSNP